MNLLCAIKGFVQNNKLFLFLQSSCFFFNTAILYSNIKISKSYLELHSYSMFSQYCKYRPTAFNIFWSLFEIHATIQEEQVKRYNLLLQANITLTLCRKSNTKKPMALSLIDICIFRNSLWSLSTWSQSAITQNVLLTLASIKIQT